MVTFKQQTDYPWTIYIVNETNDSIDYDINNLNNLNFDKDDKGKKRGCFVDNNGDTNLVGTVKAGDKKAFNTKGRTTENGGLDGKVDITFAGCLVRLYFRYPDGEYINIQSEYGWTVIEDTKDGNTASNSEYNLRIDGGGVNNPSTRDIYFHIKMSDTLQNNSQLKQNNHIISANGAYYARLQDDGNFVLYTSNDFRKENAFWASNTNGKGTGPYHITMQDDGNLVIYDTYNIPTWASNTFKNGSKPYRLIMQNDKNLVIYDGNNNAIWASNTVQIIYDNDFLLSKEELTKIIKGKTIDELTDEQIVNIYKIAEKEGCYLFVGTTFQIGLILGYQRFNGDIYERINSNISLLSQIRVGNFTFDSFNIGLKAGFSGTRFMGLIYKDKIKIPSIIEGACIAGIGPSLGSSIEWYGITYLGDNGKMIGWFFSLGIGPVIGLFSGCYGKMHITLPE